MPQFSRHSTSHSMTLPEFKDYADANVDFHDPESLFALGEQLSMLGNNRDFLSNFMADFIHQHVKMDVLKSTISQSITIAKGRGYYMRANFWLPEADMTESEAYLFAYHQAHDHNFEMLSYTYCGSGYRTELWTYDYEKVKGHVGEVVDINPLGLHHFECGDVLLYRCNQDIHIQRPPDTPSITLNVIPTQNHLGLRDQYFFNIPDVDSTQGVITHHATSNIEARRTLFQLAGLVKSPAVVTALSDVATSYDCGRSRFEALKALAKCSPEVHSDVCHQLRDDRTPIVKHYLSTVGL